MQVALTDLGGKVIGLEERRWGSYVAARIAGAQRATLLSWRRKYGFLAGSGPGTSSNAAAFQHNVVEMCVVAAVAAMVRAGISPRVACGAEWHLHTMIELLIAGEREKVIFVLSNSGPDCRSLLDPLKTIEVDSATVLNVSNIVDRVLCALGLSKAVASEHRDSNGHSASLCKSDGVRTSKLT